MVGTVKSSDSNSNQAGDQKPRARIINVRDSLVVIEVLSGAIIRNEVAYICTGRGERLKAEVLRVQGQTADLQVFEDTTGVKVGDPVELTGQMLSMELGPGLLGQVYDGLGNPLEILAQNHGFFLPRGQDISALDEQKKWDFTPAASPGDRLAPGQPFGFTREGSIKHSIMIPFHLRNEVELTWVASGALTVCDPAVRFKTADGAETEITMVQRWPVRVPIAETLLRHNFAERLYPQKPLETTIRIIDVFFPIARGGTACIPGPFGAGKTVLQSLIARYADVDVVIIVACGERAGEVVETITEYPKTKDPRTDASLMERTIIICNTSAMPVAARESSIYTGITLGEYYRQMGNNVLLLADSTSRWAQAMRETSGRMEEIPGEEAFPAYLDSSIKNIYERAGIIQGKGKSPGSLTMIGTVSPAGGNFEEPVTQATLATVKCFLGLSSDRAYKRYYPAIHPLTSWSRYLGQLEEWFTENLRPGWVQDVKSLRALLNQGEEIYQMMQVTGEEGITLEDFVTWQKAALLDMVYLQQDAFDSVDVSTSRERQLESFMILKTRIDSVYRFKDKDQARDFFTRLTGLFKNLNYSPFDSAGYRRYKGEMDRLVSENTA